jgi:hypothetical protein
VPLAHTLLLCSEYGPVRSYPTAIHPWRTGRTKRNRCGGTSTLRVACSGRKVRVLSATRSNRALGKGLLREPRKRKGKGSHGDVGRSMLGKMGARYFANKSSKLSPGKKKDIRQVGSRGNKGSK